jgi:hypothetical protein
MNDSTRPAIRRAQEIVTAVTLREAGLASQLVTEAAADEDVAQIIMGLASYASLVVRFLAQAQGTPPEEVLEVIGRTLARPT